MMKDYHIQKDILCIDLKSFYASVECVLLDLNPFTTPLVVADQSRGSGSVVLAVSPYLKTLGVPSRCRLSDLPKGINIHIQKPRMKTYMTFARDIVAIYLSYVSYEDMHIYSIDEVFLDVTSYLSYYKMDVKTLAKTILDDVLKKTGIHATCGIGKNMLLSKLALDIEAKHAKDFIASWDYEDIKQKLWTLPNLSDMWGIGSRTEKNLNRLGIKTIYDLAHTDPMLLKHHFGIIGEEMYYHAHGIDLSRIQDHTTMMSRRKSYGQSQVLFKDYYAPEIFTIIRETLDEVSRRLRMNHKAAKTISLGISYSADIGGGFGRQYTFDQPTMHMSLMYHACLDLFHTFYDGSPIRRIHVSVTNLSTPTHIQLSLFEDISEIDDELSLYEAVDYLKHTYGKHVIDRGSSLLEHSTIKARHHMVGGHHE